MKLSSAGCKNKKTKNLSSCLKIMGPKNIDSSKQIKNKYLQKVETLYPIKYFLDDIFIIPKNALL